MSERIVVVGSIALDSLETPEGKVDDAVGGSASYSAVAASFFSPVRLVAVVGRDFPESAVELFRARGIDLEGLEFAEGETFRWGGRYHTDMNRRDTLFTHLNVFENFHPRLPASYRDSEIVLLANIHPALQAEVLDQVDAPKLVALDTMNLWIDIALDDLRSVLQRVDLLFLNDEEARQLSGEHNLVRAAAAVREMGPRTVVVKKGEHGAVLFDSDGAYVQPALLLERVFDPTGAGDAFAGGFLGHLGRLGRTDPASLRQAMAVGTVLASFVTESFGPQRLAALTEEEIGQRLEHLRRITRWPFDGAVV